MTLSPDAAILLTGVLVAVAAAPLGLFLVLRGAAMLTDAVSHAVLPGIVLVWLATGAVSGLLPMFGAVAAGLATVALVALAERSRLMAGDAAVGLVFPALFALGVLLVNLYARDVHIDADAVLLGEIGLVWLETRSLFGLDLPAAAVPLIAVAAVNFAVVGLLWKELKLSSFDPVLAAAMGFRPGLLHLLLFALTAATAVAAFDAVGVILFVAFVAVPPATALLLTDRPGRALGLAVVLAVVAAVAGQAIAVGWNISIGGMMAVATGLPFLLALLAAPRNGVLARLARRRQERLDHDCRALAAHLLSHRGAPDEAEENTARALREHLRWPPARAERVILRALDRGLIRREGARLELTEKGMAEAGALFDPTRRG
ncbi:MAG: metal ABC transporter permease [Gemmobacter sp.]